MITSPKDTKIIKKGFKVCNVYLIERIFPIKLQHCTQALSFLFYVCKKYTIHIENATDIEIHTNPLKTTVIIHLKQLILEGYASQSYGSHVPQDIVTSMSKMIADDIAFKNY